MTLSKLMNKVNACVVKDWTQAWKWLSVQFAAALVLWSSLPEATQVWVATAVADFFGFKVSIPTILAMAVIVGRLVDQNGTKT